MMTNVFKKLNLTNQAEILVLNTPQSFEPEIEALTDVSVLHQLDETSQIYFAIAFVTQKAQVEELSAVITKKTAGDTIVWFAYPKKTSTRYQAEIYRDDGWDTITDLGFAPVRQVSIDEDWSALRFRRVEFIRARNKKS